VKELKELCRARKLPVSGTKAALVARLRGEAAPAKKAKKPLSLLAAPTEEEEEEAAEEWPPLPPSTRPARGLPGDTPSSAPRKRVTVVVESDSDDDADFVIVPSPEGKERASGECVVQ